MEAKQANLGQENSLNTIRALHETVVSLRSALEQSKSEILSLKTTESLKKENQQLKKHLEGLKVVKNDLKEAQENVNKDLTDQNVKSDLKRDKSKKSKSIERINVTHNVSTNKKKKKHVKVDITVELHKKKHRNLDKTMDEKPNKSESDIDVQTDNVIVPVPPTVNVTHIQKSASVDYLDQEVDNIELIFTTDDKEFKQGPEEGLVSIEPPRGRLGAHLQRPLSNYEELSGSDRELDDDVFNDNFENENQENSLGDGRFRRDSDNRYGMFDSKSDNSINNPEMKSLRSCYSYHDSSFENKSLEKDESFDRFEENIHIVETDISKIGIQESSEYISVRRNTCPNPLQYRPIIHREALSKPSRRTRPVLGSSSTPRRESGAQTDISALPSSSAWRSESSLARKIRAGDNFTTLPSKYPLPTHQTHHHISVTSGEGRNYPRQPSMGAASTTSAGGAPSGHRRPSTRLVLPAADRSTLEARRILLSDIGFTSMVPELSRSADHLCHKGGGGEGEGKEGGEGGGGGGGGGGGAVQYGRYLQAGDCSSPVYTWSPGGGSRSTSTCHLPPTTSSPAQATPSFCLDTVPHCTSFSKQHSQDSTHLYQYERQLQQHEAQRRRCSTPHVSPGRRLGGLRACCCPMLAHQCSEGGGGGGGMGGGSRCEGLRGIVRGRQVRFANGSMPDLRTSASLDCDSGDSTDSLLEETEQFLRRSIDCIVDGRQQYCGRIMGGPAPSGPKMGVRRASAPEPHRDNIPPIGWQPFLPRLPRDLRPDYWVKVIGPEGRVRGGRVRYVGVPASVTDALVGVQLPNPDGQCDGVWNGRRYFQCEPDHGLFVPFKKIVMGWKP